MLEERRQEVPLRDDDEPAFLAIEELNRAEIRALDLHDRGERLFEDHLQVARQQELCAEFMKALHRA